MNLSWSCGWPTLLLGHGWWLLALLFSTPEAAGAALTLMGRLVEVFQLFPQTQDADPELATWVEEQISARRQAREARDFQAADAIRDGLRARGVVLEDTAEGTRWKLIER